VDQWGDSSDRAMDFGELPLQDGEVLPASALDGETPDEQRLTEATGYEGASFERAYHRAALLIWPRERVADVLLQAGAGAALPHLRDRIEGCTGTRRTPWCAPRRRGPSSAIAHDTDRTSCGSWSWQAWSRPRQRLPATGPASPSRGSERRDHSRRNSLKQHPTTSLHAASGRAWARIDMTRGKLFIYQGDESTFVARRERGVRRGSASNAPWPPGRGQHTRLTCRGKRGSR
jgi:hypothetical protein